MAKPVGTIEIEGYAGKESREAYRIGSFWAVNKSNDYGPYFNVTHLATGNYLITHVKLRFACRMVGVLDTLFPSESLLSLQEMWGKLPEDLQQTFRRMSYS